MGALRLLAKTYTPGELNSKGFGLYAEFRPEVEGWGGRGEVRCEQILSLRKSEPAEPAQGRTEDVIRVTTAEESLDGEPAGKRQKGDDDYDTAFDDFVFNEEDLAALP
jgi:hypothetical protein